MNTTNAEIAQAARRRARHTNPHHADADGIFRDEAQMFRVDDDDDYDTEHLCLACARKYGATDWRIVFCPVVVGWPLAQCTDCGDFSFVPLF